MACNDISDNLAQLWVEPMNNVLGTLKWEMETLNQWVPGKDLRVRWLRIKGPLWTTDKLKSWESGPVERREWTWCTEKSKDTIHSRPPSLCSMRPDCTSLPTLDSPPKMLFVLIINPPSHGLKWVSVSENWTVETHIRWWSYRKTRAPFVIMKFSFPNRGSDKNYSC